ncbi:MAG TPA: ATP-dependent 6-phosphofructokinase [Anaerolineales bacterium]|nr:ATP-dependent 6-phosphofructokinase [Anaerolineales bacterium]
MRFGILTGGGDVPGLNAAIKTVVHRVTDEGHSIVGVRRGWAGLLELDSADPESAARHILRLDRNVVRGIDRTGGTFLHTSRTNPANVKVKDVPEFLRGQVRGDGPQDFTPHILKVLESQGIEVLVTIGGDDTLSYSLRLHNEGVPVVAIPKTMDNDVHGTDYCIGFSTAVSRSVEFIDSLRTVAGSHERIAVVELFGRYSGETSLVAGYLASADRVLISEVPFEAEKLAGLIAADRRANPSHYAVVTVSEGAQVIGSEMVLRGIEDAYGHRKLGGIGETTGELIKKYTHQEVLVQQLTYLMRAGAPDSLDRMVAMNFAQLASNLALAGTSGRMVALQNGVYTHVALTLTGEGKKRVDVDQYYDVDTYRPKVRQVEGQPMFLE